MSAFDAVTCAPNGCSGRRMPGMAFTPGMRDGSRAAGVYQPYLRTPSLSIFTSITPHSSEDSTDRLVRNG